MARVNSPYYLKGRIDCLQFYQIGSKRYVRMASSLTGKRVKKSPAFARTRASYGRLATASPIASAVYKQLPKEMRVNGYYEKMVGVVILLLKEEYTPEQAHDLLFQAAMTNPYLDIGAAEEARATNAAGIAAAVYYQLPVAMHIAGYLKALMDMALQLLEEGMGIKEAYEILYKAAMPEKDAKPITITCSTEPVSDTAFAEHMLQKIFGVSLVERAEYAEMRNRESLFSDMPP